MASRFFARRALLALLVLYPALSISAPQAAPAAALPAAAGEVPLQNLAPAPADAPLDSAGTTPALLTRKRVQLGCSLRDYGAPVERGQIASSIFNTCSGFSLHKPTFLLPLSYSPRYQGSKSEFIFQFSAKAQLWDFGPGALYFGYSQKSFFQVYNQDDSKPFRESNFNPEVFARVPGPVKLLPNLSFDLGVEHESNGQALPVSRSYNRIYIQPYWARGRQVVQLKAWWRLPEDKNRAANDPKRDDNPDLGSYYGYTELHYRRDFPWRNSLLDVMLRGNLLTGRGAIQADYSVETGPVGALFVRVFNGYGESLIDYNRSITRVGVGIALQR